MNLQYLSPKRRNDYIKNNYKSRLKKKRSK